MASFNKEQKTAQRSQDAKERLLNTPQRENKITRLLSDDVESQKLGLLKHLDDTHILKKIALSIEQAKHVAYPASTAFIMCLAVFSGYAARAYKVARRRHDKKGIPIGIYAVAEQPSGSAKDFALDMVSDIFNRAFHDFKKATDKRLKEADTAFEKAKQEKAADEKIEQSILDELKAADKLKDAIANYTMNLTDTTPAGLEISLIDTNGFFNLASSEQSLLDVLVGGLFSNGQSNNEVLLKGFDGGEAKVSRGGRAGYQGLVGGSLAVFAQKGTIKGLFNASGLSGLQERVLKIVEPNSGGERDFINGKEFNYYLIDELKTALQPLIEMILTAENITEPKSLYDLAMLEISKEAYRELNEFRQSMENHLKIGGLFYESKLDMMGTLSKCEIHALKIAACLHLLDDGCYEPEIADKHVTAAIGIVTDIFMSYSALLAGESIAGEKAQYEKILAYLEKSTKPRTIREIRDNLKGRKPFTMPNASVVIREVVESMIDHDVLEIDSQKRIIIAP